ncbi:MAG: hypothetical protein WC614_07205 [bacterium]
MNIFFVLFCINALQKPVGPLGVWCSSNGVVFNAPGIPESTYVQDAFKFGDFWNVNRPGDCGLTFKNWIDSACESWNVERYTGVILPPSENGVINVPSDTNVFMPKSPPGMIQGAARFSRLSKIYGQIYGVNIDDFEGLDTSVVHDIRDALRGKYVDSAGVVYHNTPETTPELKMFVVIYPGRKKLSTIFAPYIDGINLWIYNQNAYSKYTDQAIDKFHSKFPGKEINFGVYILNNDYGWTSPGCLNYMYKTLFNRYDNGDINGIILFAGPWVVTSNTPRDKWNDNHITALLDTIYYPYLGECEGKVYNQAHQPLDSVFISCFTIGRVSKDTLIRSKKRTNKEGVYHCGLWAGNRNTDSTLYYVVAKKEGYVPDTVSAWISRQKQTTFPDIILKVK